MELKIAQLEHQHQRDIQKILDQQAQLRANLVSSHHRKLDQIGEEAKKISAVVIKYAPNFGATEHESHQEHAADVHRAAEASQRLAADGKQFTYAVRGSSEPHLRGSVPHSIFDAEPESVLAQMYNGEWEYPRDQQGRALVNSNPAHWLLILDWLSFGIAPANPTPELVQQCKFWHLTNLLAVIDPQPKPDLQPVEPEPDDPVAGSVEISEPDNYDLTICFDSKGCRARFTVTGYLHNAVPQPQGDNGPERVVRWSAFGQCWELQRPNGRSRMQLRAEEACAPGMDCLSIQMDAGKEDPVCLLQGSDLRASALKNEWEGDIYLQEDLFMPPHIDHRGSLYISLSVTYT